MLIKKPADQRGLISLTIWEKPALLGCVIVRPCVFGETLAKQGDASLVGQGFQRRRQPPSGGCELKHERYQAMKPTIMISNLLPEGFVGAVGDRIADRIKEDGGAMLVFDWGSARE